MQIRRNQITELVNQQGYVNFSQIRESFPNVSEMTLRTDLKILDQEKKIVRVHGGAKAVQLVIGTDDYLSRRIIRNSNEKKEIAKKAVKLLLPNTTIFLDSGSTTMMFAHMFPNQANLIYTTGLNCAIELADLSEPTVLILGGNLNRFSISVYGTSVVEELKYVNFSQAFLGVTNYDSKTGFTCGNNEEAILKRTAIRQSEQVIVLMDSSKIGKKGTYSICGLKDIDVIVLNENVPKEFKLECEKYNVDIL